MGIERYEIPTSTAKTIKFVEQYFLALQQNILTSEAGQNVLRKHRELALLTLSQSIHTERFLFQSNIPPVQEVVTHFI